MSRDRDMIDDVTGRRISEEPIPLVVRISAGVPPDAGVVVDPAKLGPFLRMLLTLPRPAIELSASTFESCFVADVERLAPAFLIDEESQKRARLMRLRSESEKLQRELDAMENERRRGGGGAAAPGGGRVRP